MIPLILLIPLLAQNIYEVEGIVVTATRYPALLKDIPLATVVIDQKTIEAEHPASLSELLQNTGIDIKDYGTGSLATVSIRGVPASGVLVLLDGKPINSVQTGIGDISMIDLNSIERIEIVKGPVSSLYGANALGGVVNIITRKEDRESITNWRTRIATTELNKPFRTMENFLRFSIPKDRFNYSIEGTKSNRAGLRTNSEFNNFHLKNSLYYKLKKVDFNSDLHITLRDYGLPGPLPLIDSLHPIPVFGDSTATSIYDRETDRFIYGSLNLNYRPKENIELSAIPFGNNNSIRYHTRSFYYSEVIEDYDYNLSTLGINLSMRLDFSLLNLVFGIDIRDDTLAAVRMSPQIGDTSWAAWGRDYGIWFTGGIKPRQRICLTPGLRYDKNTTYGDFFSPHFGLSFEVTSRIWIKSSWGRAFRAPSFNDLYWPVYGNKELKPEYGNAYEVRVETSPVYYLYTALSIFNREIKDRIAWMPTKEGLWRPQNINYIGIKGVETEIKAKPGQLLRISLAATYLLARQRNKELIYCEYDWVTGETKMEFEERERDAAFVPKFAMSIKLDFTLSNDLSLNITNSYVSPRRNYYENWVNYPEITMDTKTLKGYYLLNFNVTRKFLKKAGLTLGVKNLFNIDYATQFGNSIYDRDYPMPKREVFAELTWR